MLLKVARSRANVSQIVERSAEIREHVGWEERFFAGTPVEERDLRSPSADPGAHSRSIVRREFLRDQRCANSSEDVAHAAGGHPGRAGGVVAERASLFRNDRAA